jgi:hypothetical protein
MKKCTAFLGAAVMAIMAAVLLVSCSSSGGNGGGDSSGKIQLSGTISPSGYTLPAG